jgi:hypothetical protein
MPRLFTPSRTLGQVHLFGTGSPQNWVCPAGVTLVSEVSGRGSDGAANNWLTQTIDLAVSVKNSLGPPGTTVLRDSLQVYGYAQADLFQTSDQVRSVTYASRQYVTNSGNETALITASPLTKTVRGFATLSNAGGGSGNFTYANAGFDYVRVSVQVDQGPSNGTASFAFGQTFPGGTAGPAYQTEYQNIAVTPGTTYIITMPVGGQISIYYFM